MKLSIIIPNYNGEGLLRKNLPKVIDAVKNYKEGKVEIIIPDDASSDGSIDFLKKYASEIKEKNITFTYLENKENKGFSGNVNSGVKIATGDILILLNSDVIPEKEFLPPLLSHFSDKQVFAVGCMDKSIEDGKIVLRGRGIGRWGKGFLSHGAGDLNKKNTLWAGGGSSAFRKSMWDKLGGLNEIYNPFYWEDIDLSYRALKSGYKIVFEKESVVVHEHSKGAIKTHNSQTRINKIAFRNQILFVWLNITDPFLLINHFFRLVYMLVKAILTRDWLVLQSFFQAFLLFPSVSLSRDKSKRMFVVSDKALLKQFLN